ALDELRAPEGGFEARGLRGELRGYQETGARWLSFAAGLQLGVCLADDMGLGKTIQVLAFLLARKRKAPSLLVAPASLLGNWAAQIARFAPDLWSIFDFLIPGLLGSAKSFGRFVKGLDGRGYGPLRELIRPYLLRRLKTDRAIIRDLPEKTEVTAFCGLSRQQAALYQQAID